MEPSVRLAVNSLGPKRRLVETTLTLDAAPPGRAAYANLLMAMLHGRQMVAIRDDETEEMWRIVEPVLAAWGGDRSPSWSTPRDRRRSTAGRAGPA